MSGGPGEEQVATTSSGRKDTIPMVLMDRKGRVRSPRNLISPLNCNPKLSFPEEAEAAAAPRPHPIKAATKLQPFLHEAVVAPISRLRAISTLLEGLEGSREQARGLESDLQDLSAMLLQADHRICFLTKENIDLRGKIAAFNPSSPPNPPSLQGVKADTEWFCAREAATPSGSRSSRLARRQKDISVALISLTSRVYALESGGTSEHGTISAHTRENGLLDTQTVEVKQSANGLPRNCSSSRSTPAHSPLRFESGLPHPFVPHYELDGPPRPPSLRLKPELNAARALPAEWLQPPGSPDLSVPVRLSSLGRRNSDLIWTSIDNIIGPASPATAPPPESADEHGTEDELPPADELSLGNASVKSTWTCSNCWFYNTEQWLMMCGTCGACRPSYYETVCVSGASPTEESAKKVFVGTPEKVKKAALIPICHQEVVAAPLLPPDIPAEDGEAAAAALAPSRFHMLGYYVVLHAAEPKYATTEVANSQSLGKVLVEDAAGEKGIDERRSSDAVVESDELCKETAPGFEQGKTLASLTCVSAAGMADNGVEAPEESIGTLLVAEAPDEGAEMSSFWKNSSSSSVIFESVGTGNETIDAQAWERAISRELNFEAKASDSAEMGEKMCREKGIAEAHSKTLEGQVGLSVEELNERAEAKAHQILVDLEAKAKRANGPEDACTGPGTTTVKVGAKRKGKKSTTRTKGRAPKRKKKRAIDGKEDPSANERDDVGTTSTGVDKDIPPKLQKKKKKKKKATDKTRNSGGALPHSKSVPVVPRKKKKSKKNRKASAQGPAKKKPASKSPAKGKYKEGAKTGGKGTKKATSKGRTTSKREKEGSPRKRLKVSSARDSQKQTKQRKGKKAKGKKKTGQS